MKSKIIKSSIGILLAIILFMLPGLRIPLLDDNADEYFSDAMNKAALAYGTARVINASISVIQESEVQIEPAGIGLSLAIGQILDPVDDMTERLSDVLVTSIASLGIQKIAFEVSTSFVPRLLGIIIFIISILIWINNKVVDKIGTFLFRSIILLVVVRLFLPLSSVVNDIVYNGYFEEEISKTRNQLEVYAEDIDKFKDFDFPASDGIWQTITNSASFLTQKAVQFSDALVSVVDNVGGIVDSLVQLTWLYLGLFVIQVIILPIMMFWFLTKMANALFETDLPYLLKHRRSARRKKIPEYANSGIK